MGSDNERYEALRYPGHPFDFSHPDRLATIAQLRGLNAPAVQTARVLELGCGEGWNLLGMAYQLPRATFVAVDACSAPMDLARQAASELGMDNIEFRVADIHDMIDGPDTFDYIIAHGVLSWVPAATRRALFETIGTALSPNGLAMVSFNTLPGWHFRLIARDMIHAVVGNIPTREQLPEAREAVRIFAENLVGEGIYGDFVAELQEHIEDCDDADLFHDLLSPSCDALDFRSFAELYQSVGLQYVGDAEWSAPDFAGYPPEFRKMLGPVMDQPERREQLVDLMRNTLFRRSVLCRAGRQITWQPRFEHVEALHVAMIARFVGATEQGDEYETDCDTRSSLTVTDPVASARLAVLRDKAPAAMLIAAFATAVEARTDAARDDVMQLLLQAWSGKLVELLPRDRPHTVTPGPTPTGFGLARWQAARGAEQVINSLHEDVELEPDQTALLLLCDGTRSRQQIIDALIEGGSEATAIGVDDGLARLGELALLEIEDRCPT